MNKLAIFDVDGTLFNGNLGIDFVQQLVKEDIFTSEVGIKIYEWYKKYKNGVVDKLIAVEEIYKFYNLGLKDRDKDLIKQVAEKTWENVNSKVFLFARTLVNQLIHNNFSILLISGSPIEMVSLLGKDLNITSDSIIAGISEILEGRYTGSALFYPGNSEQKVLALNEYLSRNNISVDWSRSLALGDDERDFGIFKMVKFPFAINPNNKLLELCRDLEGFSVVTPADASDKIISSLNLQ